LFHRHVPSATTLNLTAPPRSFSRTEHGGVEDDAGGAGGCGGDGEDSGEGSVVATEVLIVAVVAWCHVRNLLHYIYIQYICIDEHSLINCNYMLLSLLGPHPNCIENFFLWNVRGGGGGDV
jgi:hypothetical protein